MYPISFTLSNRSSSVSYSRSNRGRIEQSSALPALESTALMLDKVLAQARDYLNTLLEYLADARSVYSRRSLWTSRQHRDYNSGVGVEDNKDVGLLVEIGVEDSVTKEIEDEAANSEF